MKKTLFFTALLGAVLSFNAQTVIFEETFESLSQPGLPSGWITIDRDGDGQKWEGADASSFTDPLGFSGKVAVTGSTPTSDHLLVSPPVNLQAGNTYSLSFLIGTWTLGGFYPADNYYAVYILPSTSTFMGTETPVLEESIATGDIAMLKTIDLSSYAGQSVTIYFRQYNFPQQGVLIVDTVRVTQQSMLGTVETNSTSGVGIYPNPASEYVYLKSKSKITHAEIFDSTGRRMNAQYSGSRIDVRNLQPGTYLIKITSGNETYSQKLIKK
ncbi:T9SS type A sorting domain-containing protein [Chryseobacterium gallinarum]|uniref:T9SS-dependent choice-of-anchor J family protein n=1 Tax=Chryseobacterium gallinarum TaxID=1324352 RepID=UPI002023F9DB|nr:T9SS type A sorting domain-containing protein [Chryseobacterium gallinarum]MCL8538217.1 T9SS type A sorting domain-containing protein [Chryseobacterium gallinarum]